MRRLIYSLKASCQVSTILRANANQVADHHHKIDQAPTNAAQGEGAFLPFRERDLFQLGPLSMVLLELDPAHQDLLFPDLSLEDPDLESIMGDEISPEMKTMILVAVKESHAKNQQMVQLMDAKARSLYSSAA